MSNADTARVISLLLWIMLVVSALVARRMSWRQSLRMALAWIAIFATLFVIASFKDEFGGMWQRVRLARDPQSGLVQGGALRVPMDSDGHFRVRVSLNGSTASFMVDSGATTTAISTATAGRAGIAIDQSGFGVAIDTANGTIIARRIVVGRLEVGPIRRQDFHAITAPEFGDTNVLGMNFLSSLSGWGVEGRTLVLTP
jgi:aspartyl protease family protein